MGCIQPRETPIPGLISSEELFEISLRQLVYGGPPKYIYEKMVRHLIVDMAKKHYGMAFGRNDECVTNIYDRIMKELVDLGCYSANTRVLRNG